MSCTLLALSCLDTHSHRSHRIWVAPQAAALCHRGTWNGYQIRICAPARTSSALFAVCLSQVAWCSAPCWLWFGQCNCAPLLNLCSGSSVSSCHPHCMGYKLWLQLQTGMTPTHTAAARCQPGGRQRQGCRPGKMQILEHRCTCRGGRLCTSLHPPQGQSVGRCIRQAPSCLPLGTRTQSDKA
jgi:hypothetical protein